MKWYLTMVICCSLVGCATSEVKAPCDYQAHFCGQKMRINADE